MCSLLLLNIFKEEIAKKKFISCFIIFLFFCFSNNILATEITSNNNLENNIIETSYTTITPDSVILNGDAQVLNTTVQELPDENRILKKYEFFIPIKNSSNPSLFNLDGHSKNESGINVSIYVDYSISSDNSKVKINRFYGNWYYQNDLYYLTDRLIGCHSGLNFDGNSFNQKIYSDSFDYYLNWGYVDRLFGPMSPRAWAEATAHVYDMEGSHRIVIEFPFS